MLATLCFLISSLVNLDTGTRRKLTKLQDTQIQAPLYGVVLFHEKFTLKNKGIVQIEPQREERLPRWPDQETDVQHRSQTCQRHAVKKREGSARETAKWQRKRGRTRDTGGSESTDGEAAGADGAPLDGRSGRFRGSETRRLRWPHVRAGSHGREQELGHGTATAAPTGMWLVETEQETHKLHAQESSIGRERVTGKAGDRCSTEGWRKTRCLRTALEICLSSASKREREANMGDVSNCDKPEEKQTSWEERGVETCPSEQESKRRFRPRKTVSPCLRARQFL